MKKGILIAAVVTSVVLAASAVIYEPEPVAGVIDKQEAGVFAEDDKENEKYILSEGEGNIIIRYKDEIFETDISTSGMRAYDRELLKAGIEAETYEEVLMLLEDFNS